MSYADITGASGVFLLLLAFVLAGLKRIDSQRPFYFLLNTIGAGMACYASFLIQYFPFVILEGVWAVVSVVGLIRSVNRDS
jgi:hypothetical protein